MIVTPCATDLRDTRVGLIFVGADPLADLETRYPNLATMPAVSGEQASRVTQDSYTSASLEHKMYALVYFSNVLVCFFLNTKELFCNF